MKTICFPSGEKLPLMAWSISQRSLRHLSRLASEVVEIEAAVPCVVIRIAVEDDPAVKPRRGVGRIRGLFASAAPRRSGCGLACESYGTRTPKVCSGYRGARSVVAEVFRLTRRAGNHLRTCRRGHCQEDNGLDRGASKLARGVHRSDLKYRMVELHGRPREEGPDETR